MDRLPEEPSRVQIRGTVVHSVLEQLFGLPAPDRVPTAAKDLVPGAWDELRTEHPELAELFAGPDDPELAEWLDSARGLVDAYFNLEDPSRIQPEACELLVEAELPAAVGSEPVRLRGYVDRLDVAPGGEIRVVDYKTGAAPREIFEAKALFQMKFYALVLLRTRGVLVRRLQLMYLADEQCLVYCPDEAELDRFEGTLVAIWDAIMRAAPTGDFRPNPSRLCDWCSHKPLCPAHGGAPPPYPGWPDPGRAAVETDESLDDLED